MLAIHNRFHPAIRLSLVLLLLSALLSACAGIESTQYTVPQSGPLAKVTIFTQDIAPMHGLDIYALDYAKCETDPRYYHVGHLQEKGLFNTQRLSVNTQFPAQQLIPLRIFYTQHEQTVYSPCKISVAYTFEESAEYEIEISVVGHRCEVQARLVRTPSQEFKENEIIAPTDFKFKAPDCDDSRAN